MNANHANATLSATLVFAGLWAGLALGAAQPGRPGRTVRHAVSQAATPSGVPGNSPAQAPTDAEIRARSDKLIANQHRDDKALDEYERVERHRDLTAGANPHTIEDHTYRVVPNGGGTQKILLKDAGKPTDPAEYRRQLQAWESVLEIMLKPNDSRTKTAQEKYDKRMHERADLVDAMKDAYTVKWLGLETRNGRLCDVIQLDPNPNFHPRSIFQEALAHATAKIWVDHTEDQLVRGEALITHDISVGGGIVGKLYRGSSFSMEQAEVSPSIWLPTRYQYDFTGRKFFFGFEQHQIIDASRYRRVGPPKEALALVESELASGKTFSEDP